MNILYYVIHPDIQRSLSNQALYNELPEHPNLQVVDLYSEYPNFYVDAQIEHQRLDWADSIFFQHPLYWYSAPAILHLWFEAVLSPGYAYGKTGNALIGKHWQHIISTGGKAEAYQPEGYNQHTIDELLLPIESVAKLCRCQWHAPLVNFGAKHATSKQLNAFDTLIIKKLQDLLREQYD